MIDLPLSFCEQLQSTLVYIVYGVPSLSDLLHLYLAHASVDVIPFQFVDSKLMLRV
jgi:hypothetical protein